MKKHHAEGGFSQVSFVLRGSRKPGSTFSTNYFRIPAPVFRQMIRRTSFATDTESTRYALGGLLLEFGEGTVIVATDSRRLAVATAACEKEGKPVARTSQRQLWCRRRPCRCWNA
ncbi:MAG: hypothetical protein U0936_20345 [Planctomycetaceae bacterium]